jgi:prevent-host-death family protein
MKTLTYDETKDNILEILKLVKSGEEIIIKNSKTRKNIAVIVPYEKYQQKGNAKKKQERTLGILKGKASYKIKGNFQVTDEEFLAL